MSNTKSETIKKVLNGHFPKETVRKLNRERLERLVLKLVECSSEQPAKNATSFTGLYRGLCLKQINKPKWWPSEKIIEQSLTSNGKYFMQVLRFLVYKCCEFFKKPCENLNERVFGNTEVNDENIQVGIKRKRTEVSPSYVAPPSKRRTLMPKNSGATGNQSPITIEDEPREEFIIKNPIIRLKDIFYTPKPKPLTQEAFLNIFQLQSSSFSNNVEDDNVPYVASSSIKFNSCSIIPFSSDLGLELMKRDNHKCPEALKTRKLDRLEWYVNQKSPRVVDIKYEVTYAKKKEETIHYFKFPKRQSWQHPGDFTYQKLVLFCTPLKVVLAREDLVAKKQKLRSIRHDVQSSVQSTGNQKNVELKVLVSKISLSESLTMDRVKNSTSYPIRPRERRKSELQAL